MGWLKWMGWDPWREMNGLCKKQGLEEREE